MVTVCIPSIGRVIERAYSTDPIEEGILSLHRQGHRTGDGHNWYSTQVLVRRGARVEALHLKNAQNSWCGLHHQLPRPKSERTLRSFCRMYEEIPEGFWYRGPPAAA